MAGRRPKPPEQRQRRNRAPTADDLPPPADSKAAKVPGLPSGQWARETREWWRAVWTSPMAAKFLEADRHALVRLAALVERFWKERTKELASEIRLQEARFGLTPMDRHRLQWNIAADAPPEKRRTKARRESDPRAKLRLVQ